MAGILIRQGRCLFSYKSFSVFFSNHFCTMESTEPVIVEKQGKLHLIGINRPEKRNCVNIQTGELLRKAFKSFEDDEEASVAVLYGKGGNFCAGFDLQQLAEGNIHDMPIDNGPMGPTRMLLKKPVIAAVSGYAVAGGLELALWCDLRVVEETAIMGVFCRRFGVPLIDGGTVRLPQLIGLSRAMDLILTGRGISAKEALEMGLANRVVACGSALGQAVSLANCIAKFPQECVKADRHSAYYAAYKAKSLEEALRFEFENSTHVIAEESVKGAQGFVEGIGRHGKFNLNKSQL